MWLQDQVQKLNLELWQQEYANYYGLIILDDLKIQWSGPMKLYCDNKSAISIAHNPVQHDRTKHIEIDRHFIKEKLDNGLICTPYVPSKHQLADVLTKGLNSNMFQENISKLGRKIYIHQLEGECGKSLKINNFWEK